MIIEESVHAKCGWKQGDALIPAYEMTYSSLEDMLRSLAWPVRNGAEATNTIACRRQTGRGYNQFILNSFAPQR